jgi:hypothetical protein
LYEVSLGNDVVEVFRGWVDLGERAGSSNVTRDYHTVVTEVEVESSYGGGR